MKSHIFFKNGFYFISIFILSNITLITAKNKGADIPVQSGLQNAMLTQDDRKGSIHDGNNIRTVFYNYGSVGRPNTEPSFEWPFQSNHGYADEFGLIIGAEVIDENGAKIHIFSDGLIDGGDRSPGGKVWGWQPLPESVNPNWDTPAMSNNPDSWPPGWTAWPGLQGEGIISADLESYWIMDDRDNDEFEYYPFLSDSSLRGLGLQVTCRGYQWDNMFDEDFIIFTYDIKNISEKPLGKVVVGIFGDPHIGGPGDFADDYVGYSAEDNLVYCYDEEGSGNDYGIPWAELGWLGIEFMETPKNTESQEIGLTSVAAPVYATVNATPSLDENMWQSYTPGNFDDLAQGMDNVLEAGSGYFSLSPESTQVFSVAFIMGKGLEDLQINADNAKAAYSNLMGEITPTVEIIAPVKDAKMDSNVSIQWAAHNADGLPMNIDLYYDSGNDAGKKLIASNLPNDGNYLWNTMNLKSGTMYKIGIQARTETAIGRAESDFFTIVHAGDSSAPEIKLFYPKASLTLKGQVNILWNAGDADGDSLTITIYYSMDKGKTWNILKGDLPNTGSYVWETRQLPNGNAYKTKLSVSDGSTETESYSSSTLCIHNEYEVLQDSLVTHLRGPGDGTVEVSIVNPYETTGHIYQVIFDDTSSSEISYDVYDSDAGQLVVENCTQLSADYAGPLFDGIRLIVDNIEQTTIDEENSRWISGNPNVDMNLSLFPSGGVRYPADFEVHFFGSVVDTSVMINPQSVKFKIWNVTEQKQMDILFFDNNSNGEFEIDDKIVIIHYIDGAAKGSWQIKLSEPEEGAAQLPQAGDVFFLRTVKTFSSKDVFQFKAPDALVSIKDKKHIYPQKFSLSQNYPNPFNPVTSIGYHVSARSFIDLSIYNMLGQKVKTLVSKEQAPGNYKVQWDASQFSSGIYLIRLQSDAGFSQVKKSIFIK